MPHSFPTRRSSDLRDGLPLGRTDDVGDSIYTDPLAADYIEVLRGANAMQYGVATLGGAVNLVSSTGYTRPGFKVRLDGGAYRSEEHTSELQSLMRISYAVFCLKKKQDKI